MQMLRKVYSLKQKILEMKYSRQNSLGNVYMFHQVNNDRDLWDDISCCISRDSFGFFIKELAGNGAVFRNIDSAFLSEPVDDKSCLRVAITFDDAYDDVYHFCYPLLKELNIPFSIFVAWDYIGKTGYLTEQMIFEMVNSGLCTIGSHTLSHVILRKLSRKNVLYELKESRRLLSDCFGRDVDTMAFPYGSIYACSKANVGVCGMAGYDIAFSTLNCHLTAENLNNNFFIPRRNVNEEKYRELLRCWNARN